MSIHVNREGIVTQTSQGETRRLGYLDRGDHTGRRTRTWRVITTSGATLIEGLPTRRKALAWLLERRGVEADA